MTWVTKIIDASLTTSLVSNARVIAGQTTGNNQFTFGTYISYDGIAYASMFSADDLEFKYPSYRSFVSSTLSEAGFKVSNLNANVLDFGNSATVYSLRHHANAVYCGTYEELVAVGADSEVNSFHYNGNQFPPFYNGIAPKGRDTSNGIELTQPNESGYLSINVADQYVPDMAFEYASFNATKSYKNYFGANGDTNEIYMVLWDNTLARVVSFTYMAPIKQDANYTGSFPVRYGILQANTFADDTFSISLSTPVFTGADITSYKTHTIVTSTLGNVESSGTLQDFASLGFTNGLGKNLSPVYMTYSNGEDSPFILGKFGNVLFGRSAASNFTLGEVVEGYHVFPSKYLNFPTIAVPVDKVSSYTPPVIPIKLAPLPPPVIPDPVTNQPKVNPEGTNYTALYKQFESLAAAGAMAYFSYVNSQKVVSGAIDQNSTDQSSYVSDAALILSFKRQILSRFDSWANDPNRSYDPMVVAASSGLVYINLG